MDLSLFIKSINVDEQDRIIVFVQDMLASYLVNEEYRGKAKDILKQILGDDFVQLEVSNVSFRISCAEGTGQACREKLETELQQYIALAMQMMGGENQ